MAAQRVWCICRADRKAAAQAALDALGDARLDGSFLAQYPSTGTAQFFYFGLQATAAQCTAVGNAVAAVPNCYAFRGARHGEEREEDVMQPGELPPPATPIPANTKMSRRAIVRRVHQVENLGEPTPETLVQQPQS